jgi:hypothetical protein
MVFRIDVSDTTDPKGVKLEMPRPARGLIVHSGAAGVKLYLDKPHDEHAAVEAISGLCVARDFDEVWVRGTDADQQADVIFEALDCAPVHVADVGANRVHFVKNVYQQTIAEGAPGDPSGFEPTTTTLLNAAYALNLDLDDNRFQPLRAFTIGGAIRCTKAFRLRLWTKLSEDAGNRCYVASMLADVPDPDGSFSGNLETGWRKESSALGPLHQTAIVLALPWELEIYIPSGEEAEVSAVIYTRDQ